MVCKDTHLLFIRKHIAERRAEQRRRTELERAAQAAEEEAEMKEVAATCEPLLAERQLTSALLLYCEGLLGSSSASTPLSPVSPGGDGAIINGHGMFLALPLSSAAARRRSSGFSAYSGASSHYATPLGCSPATTPLSGSPPVSIDEDKPGFYKKKEEGGEVFFAGTGKKTKKRNRNERRLSFRKGLTHNPETLRQFSSLGIEPPASILGVEEVITRLREKLSSLEMQAAETKLARLTASENPESQNTNGVSDKVSDAAEIPEIKVDGSCDPDNSAVLRNSEDPPQVSVNGQTDRKKLSLDLKFPCIPEIKVQTSPQLEVDNKDVSNTHDEIPIVLITSEDSKSSAYIDPDCDRASPNDSSAPHDSPNSIDLVPTQTKTTSSSKNNASFSQTNGRTP